MRLREQRNYAAMLSFPALAMGSSPVRVPRILSAWLFRILTYEYCFFLFQFLWADRRSQAQAIGRAIKHGYSGAVFLLRNAERSSC